jgi:PKD repeat protein
MNLRSSNEPRTYTAADGSTQPRECWNGQTEDLGTERFYQGSIGTHGLHILLIAESDNARQTVPLTELVAEQRMVMLPGQRDGSVGEQYGRGFEKPLVATVLSSEHAANQPPQASFDFAPEAPQTGREVSFTSTSTDDDGGIASQVWDLDGDGQFDDAEGATASHTFTTAGEHTVALRVTDTSGATDQAATTINVTNPAPTATISYSPAEPVARETITFTAQATDENGTVVGYAWDLDGDGQFDDGSAAQVTHVFLKPGEYPVALRVTDNDGATTEVERNVGVKKRGRRP